MSDVQLNVDTASVNQMFDRLKMTNKEARSAVQRAYRASGNIIKKQAQSNMRHVLPRIQKWIPYVNVTVYRNSQGLRVDALGVYSSGKGLTEAQKKKDARYTSYKMRFFNWGTMTHRKTKKGYNRGLIASTRFMSNAIVSKTKEAVASLESNLFKYINKVVSKRK